MTTHTAGPWHTNKAGQGRLVYAGSEHAFDLAFVRNGGSDRETDANAQLIASAPTMAEVIRQGVDRLHDLPRYLRVNGDKVLAAVVDEVLSNMAAAYQTATGEYPAEKISR